MSPGLEDPIFGGRIPIVDGPLDYKIELGGQTTPTYRVTVFEYPRLEKADARLVYPSYTGLEPRVVQDVRTVSVVEGTELTLTCFLNKQVDVVPPDVLTADNDGDTVDAALACRKRHRKDAAVWMRPSLVEQ